MELITLTEKINTLLTEKEHVIIAIDGPCASGKTTLAKKLSEIFDANVFHTDDYFLRPEQRTPERLSETGGNLDRERFFDEVISPLTENRDFLYRPFSCKTQSIGEAVSVKIKPLSIVEGSYSHHPFFGNVYDLRIFTDISEEEQKKRILLRNPDKADRFFGEWIPKENAYFKLFGVKEKSDIVL